jgi:hypothetical protein
MLNVIFGLCTDSSTGPAMHVIHKKKNENASEDGFNRIKNKHTHTHRSISIKILTY